MRENHKNALHEVVILHFNGWKLLHLVRFFLSRGTKGKQKVSLVHFK